MNKAQKKPYLITALIIISISIIGIYMFINNASLEFQWGEFIWYTSESIVLTTAVVLIFYFLINKPQKDEAEKPKDPVAIKRVMEIVEEELGKSNEMQIQLSQDRKGEYELINPSHLKWLNTKHYADPLSNTSDMFFRCNLIIREGIRTGIVNLIITTDLGEKYIRDNLMGNIEWGITSINSPRDQSQYPLTSPQTQAERIEDKKLEMARAGWTDYEAEKLLQPYKDIQNRTPNNTPPPQIIIPPIRSSSPKSPEPNKEDENNLSDDIERIRDENNE